MSSNTQPSDQEVLDRFIGMLEAEGQRAIRWVDLASEEFAEGGTPVDRKVSIVAKTLREWLARFVKDTEPKGGEGKND